MSGLTWVGISQKVAGTTLEAGTDSVTSPHQTIFSNNPEFFCRWTSEIVLYLGTTRLVRAMTLVGLMYRRREQTRLLLIPTSWSRYIRRPASVA